MPKSNRRRILFVSHVQYRLIISVMALLIIVSTVIAIAALIILKNNFAGMISPTMSVIIFTGITLVLYAVSLWMMIIWSNRIYGPVHRLGNYIQRLCRGERTGEIKFRKGDALDGITEIFNELSHSLERNLTYDYKELARIFTDLEDVLDKIYSKKMSDREVYDALQRISNRIAKALDITSDTLQNIDNRQQQTQQS
jgi:signal transduction histidine kinase